MLLGLTRPICAPQPPTHRALLVVAEQNGNHLHECWTEVLRCVSRFELLQQLTAGVPTDALLFAMPAEKGSAAGGTASKLKQRLLRGRGAKGEGEDSFAHDSFSSINDMGLHAGALLGALGKGGWCMVLPLGCSPCSCTACMRSRVAQIPLSWSLNMPPASLLLRPSQQAGGRWTASCCRLPR